MLAPGSPKAPQQCHFFHGWMMTTMMMAMMISRTMTPQQMSLRVLFCSRLASTNAVVPADTYSTDLDTCSPSTNHHPTFDPPLSRAEKQLPTT